MIGIVKGLELNRNLHHKHGKETILDINNNGISSRFIHNSKCRYNLLNLFKDLVIFLNTNSTLYSNNNLRLFKLSHISLKCRCKHLHQHNKFIIHMHNSNLLLFHNNIFTHNSIHQIHLIFHQTITPTNKCLFKDIHTQTKSLFNKHTFVRFQSLSINNRVGLKHQYKTRITNKANGRHGLNSIHNMKHFHHSEKDK